jgi:hypothetical protein
MAFKRALAAARRRVPEPDRAAIAGRKKPTVSREGYGTDPTAAKSRSRS